MSDSSEQNPRASVSAEGSGVLAGLPRTRPQRASARRAASRAAKPSVAGKAAPATTQTQATRKPSMRNAAPARKAPRAQAKKRAQAKSPRPVGEPVPKQGFEAEPDPLHGPVHPPGGAELVASAAELAGELAKAGVNTGARVLRDFLSRLPG